ncbi:MAG: TetR/AcrR family transcriptional regulator [Chromatiales bacterium]|jgi:AcrR family transcriptional regulator
MSNRTTQSLRGDALKNQVLDTALELFSERGYFNTSIHDIRRAAGVSTGAIYHHFHNKEALAKSLYLTLLQQMDQSIADACWQKQGCFEKCRAIIEKLFSLTLEQPRHMQFVLLAQHREYLPNETPICSSKPFQAMKTAVVEGMATGEVRQMQPWVAATAMFGGALRMMNLQLDGVLEQPLTDCLDEVVDCAWRGIKA